jgi:hypothetical protein
MAATPKTLVSPRTHSKAEIELHFNSLAKKHDDMFKNIIVVRNMQNAIDRNHEQVVLTLQRNIKTLQCELAAKSKRIAELETRRTKETPSSNSNTTRSIAPAKQSNTNYAMSWAYCSSGNACINPM